MYKILCITNSSVCESDFLKHIEALAQSRIYGIVLREKQLSADDYYYLAKAVIGICKKYDKLCILHNFVEEAVKLKHYAIHCPMPVLEKNTELLKNFDIIGASTHSIAQAQKAKELGASYITYGHIFPTDCKKGLAPKGLSELKEIVRNVDIPIYPLGGINAENFREVISCGTDGFAVMSGLMKKDYGTLLNALYSEKQNHKV